MVGAGFMAQDVRRNNIPILYLLEQRGRHIDEPLVRVYSPVTIGTSLFDPRRPSGIELITDNKELWRIQHEWERNGYDFRTQRNDFHKNEVADILSLRQHQGSDAAVRYLLEQVRVPLPQIHALPMSAPAPEPVYRAHRTAA